MPAAEPPLDPIAVLASLGLHDAARVTPVTGGADAAIWRVDTASAAYALRLFRPGQAAMAQREIAAMAAARACSLPVPHIHRDGNHGDRPALLIDWMPGQPLRHELAIDPRQARALGEAFGRAQAMMHHCPAPAEFPRDRHAWIALASPDDAFRERLRKASSESEALLHLDYHPLNVLVAHRRVTAILDWANARAGDPRADLARTASILRFAPLDTDLPAAHATVVRRDLAAGWRHGYHAVAGPPHGMAPFYAWAGLFMERDLAPRVGRPDLPWLTEAFLETVRAWTADWRARADRSAGP